MKTDWADLVGMPDEADKQNLQFIIDLYDKIHPGEIAMIVRQEREAERDNGLGGSLDPYLLKNKQSDLRKVIAMPPNLVGTIKESYPTLFKDKKHFSWFVRNFPAFRISEKY